MTFPTTLRLTALPNGRTRPSSLKMTEGETNSLSFDLCPIVGVNGLDSATWVSTGLTFTNTDTDGNTATATVANGQADTDYIVTITATLDTGEVRIFAPVFQWKAPGHMQRAGC